MSLYLEIPELDKRLPFRSFIHKGDVLCYPHWHKEIEIIYVTQGSLDLGMNDKVMRLKQGEVQIINGGDVHFFLSSPDSERIVIQFDLILFQDVSSLIYDDRSLRDIFTEIEHSSWNWPHETVTKLIPLLQSISTEDIERKEGYAYMIKAKLYEMLAFILRDIPRSSEQHRHQSSENTLTPTKEMLMKLERIFEYVENHYQESITLKDVADYIGFSPYYFTKFFKKNTGMTFVTFLNEYRINKAKWILLNENYSITEVAEEAGFSSVKTFHHFFKEATGTSPLKYRMTISENKTARK
ncbi:AraC family transcriptional regulator [Paenibacillus pabuli]|uniref:AraC family transcriptional regulator n=1 Tax=Paenibacillus pabuli TaxID=1472 RepID=UPI003CE8310E